MGAKLSSGGGGGGGSGKLAAQNADINVTPFVDIMLVLLIIFMVAAPMATVSIRLDLPPAVPNDDPNPEEPVYISIQESGELFIAENPTTLATLASDACAALGGANCRDERVFVEELLSEPRFQRCVRVGGQRVIEASSVRRGQVRRVDEAVMHAQRTIVRSALATGRSVHLLA